jgi:hypothetical protein
MYYFLCIIFYVLFFMYYILYLYNTQWDKEMVLEVQQAGQQ